MKCRLIFLTGMPGAGKTFWGKKWAADYNWHFIDIDEAIEAQAGKPVSGIFAEDGEAYFRKLESKVLMEVIQQASQHTIISTGGGTILLPENRKAIADFYSVWIDAPLPLLSQRLQSQTSERPLLSTGNLEEKLSALLAARKPFYASADLHLDAEQLTIHSFSEILELCTKQH